MAAWSELFPPIAAIAAITWLEWDFPEQQIDDTIDLFEKSLADDPNRYRNLRWAVKHLAQGWQTTVDLTYAFLATITLLVIRVIDGHAKATSPVFWTIMVLIVVNVALLGWCARLGPEHVVAAPVKLPCLGRISLRRISVGFVVLNSILTVVAIVLEILLL
jgi:hypothetical protein